MNRLMAWLAVGLAAGLGACAPRPAVAPPGVPRSAPPTTAPKAAPTAPPASEPPPPPAGPASGMREAFPHVRVDQAAGVVEIDGIVPIDAHNKETPDVYLEVTVCTRDSKEHESLVMTDAKPSQVHAALLLLGLKPGKPGSVAFDGKALARIPPTGDGLEVTFVYKNAQGKEVEDAAADWVVSADSKSRFKASGAGPSWVFAGSRFVRHNGRDWYDADGAGTLIGLTTFGGETVAWTDVHSPESAVDEPEWIADAARVPPYATPVVVRIRPAR